MPSARAALARLVDYAGLFPPAHLAMAPALEEFDAARAGEYAWMLGRFIVPASRLQELLSARSPSEAKERIALSVIVDAQSDPRSWLNSAQAAFGAIAGVRAGAPQVSIETLEIALPRLATQRDSFDAAIGQCAMLTEAAGLRDLPMFVEIPRDGRWPGILPDAMTALARFRLNAKVRCGGLTDDAYPVPDELAAFIAAALQSGVAFKATAGLHHPVRHYNRSANVAMHGFLNILIAAASALDAQPETLAGILAEEDPAAFVFQPNELVANGRHFTPVEIQRARAAFVSYGSCSFSEPVDDLTALAILPAAA